MADIQTREEFEAYIKSMGTVGSNMRDEIIDSMTDQQRQVLGFTTTAGGEFDDAVPSDVALPEGMTPEEASAAIKAESAKTDPLGTLLHTAAERDAWEREQYETQQGKRDALATGGKATLEGAGAAANAANLGIVSKFNAGMDPLLQQGEYGDYVGDAQADPLAKVAQHMAAGEYARRAQGGFTGVEKAQQEVNRRMQERNLRSQREAHMRGMQMRGAGSSGLEVAQMLGAQQNTAERQMMQNMQNEANAQQRADRALDAGSGLVSNIRGQSFGEDSFNKGLQANHQQNQARHVQEEQKRIAAGHQTVAGVEAGAVADGYKYLTAPTTFEANVVTGNPVTQPGSGFADAITKKHGANQANAAAEALEDDGLLGGAIIPGIL